MTRFAIQLTNKANKIAEQMDADAIYALLMINEPSALPIVANGQNQFVLAFSDEQMSELSNKAKQFGMHIGAYCSAILNGLGLRGNSANQRTEAFFQKRLWQKLGGYREVHVPSGRIDILTFDKIIEVKIKSGYKGAIGQVLAYSFDKPGYLPCLALIGDRDHRIEKLAKELGIYSIFWLSIIENNIMQSNEIVL